MPSSFMQYQTYDELVERIKQFPNHHSLGKDASGDYDIWAIEVGERWKPTLFLTSSVHGSEWHTTNYSLRFFERFINGEYDGNDVVKRILSNFHIFYIPIVNPYGLDNVTNPFKQFDNKSRRNANNVDLNRDFDVISQPESKIIAEIVTELKPFASVDMHMFQTEYDLNGGRNMILGGANLGVPEVNEIRDKMAGLWEARTNEPVHVWKVSPGDGLLRRFIAEHSNEYTPHNLAYITEMVRPTEIDGEIQRPLSDDQIYRYGIESILTFFETSIEYFDRYNRSVVTDSTDTVYVRDLSGVEYPVQATLINDYELNGNQTLSAVIYPSNVNKAFIEDISEMWEIIDYENVTHKIVYLSRRGEGNSLTVEIKAVPLFFDTFDTERVYDEYDEHMTAMKCFNIIFEGSGFNFILGDTFDAVQWEGLGGGETRLEMFKRALDRYKAEFYIHGNTVYLHKLIGRDTQFQYRYRLNASNIVQEHDATEFYTYAKGYGDYDEESEEEGGGWKEAKLKREYTSPLAKIPQIGIRHAPPIKNGNITLISTMDSYLKTLVDESLKISVSADIHDLRRQGYALAQPMLGDRVFVIDERIGLNIEARVVDIEVVKDWRGRVKDISLTFGTGGVSKRYQARLHSAIKDITEVMSGRKKVPYTALDNEILLATKALQNAQTELKFTSQGILAVDKRNPNLVTVMNSSGLGVSTDGGATFRNAITGRGIVADLITVGTLKGIIIEGVEIYGSKFFQTSGRREIQIRDGQVYSYYDGDLSMSFGQYELDFYHKDGSTIGSFGPTSIIDDPTKQGLALTVQNDFITIGHWRGDRRRPVFRTQRFGESKTVVTGPYERVGVQTELVLGANSRIALSSADDDTGTSTNQPTLRLVHKSDGGNSINNAYLYFGGLGTYSDQFFEIRANTSKTESTQIAKFQRSYIRLNTPNVYFGGTSARITGTDEHVTMWSTSDTRSGIRLYKGGQVDFIVGGEIKHKFRTNGTKEGGSIEIDGVNLGMSPVDSPQVLIEYIDFDINVSEFGTEIVLDDKFRKAVENYAVFPSNPNTKVVDKQYDRFTLKGEGVTDIRIVGKRVGYGETFWGVMGNADESEDYGNE